MMGQTHVVVSERKKTNFVINANVAVVGKHIRVPKIATVQKFEPNFQLKYGVIILSDQYTLFGYLLPLFQRECGRAADWLRFRDK